MKYKINIIMWQIVPVNLTLKIYNSNKNNNVANCGDIKKNTNLFTPD